MWRDERKRREAEKSKRRGGEGRGAEGGSGLGGMMVTWQQPNACGE